MSFNAVCYIQLNTKALHWNSKNTILNLIKSTRQQCHYINWIDACFKALLLRQFIKAFESKRLILDICFVLFVVYIINWDDETGRNKNGRQIVIWENLERKSTMYTCVQCVICIDFDGWIAYICIEFIGLVWLLIFIQPTLYSLLRCIYLCSS